MSLDLLAAILGSALAANGASEASPATRTPVEVWRGGDDGLTLQFAAALETAFRASTGFSTSSGKQPGTLIVTIPSALAWKEVGGRVRVSFKVTYSDVASRPLGTAKAKCWEDDLEKCAANVVKRAIDAARDIR